MHHISHTSYASHTLYTSHTSPIYTNMRTYTYLCLPWITWLRTAWHYATWHCIVGFSVHQLRYQLSITLDCHTIVVFHKIALHYIALQNAILHTTTHHGLRWQNIAHFKIDLYEYLSNCLTIRFFMLYTRDWACSPVHPYKPNKSSRKSRNSWLRPP